MLLNLVTPAEMEVEGRPDTDLQTEENLIVGLLPKEDSVVHDSSDEDYSDNARNDQNDPVF